MLERRLKYVVFVAKPEGKKPLGRLRCRWWEDNIKNGYSRKEMGAWTGLNWPKIGTSCGLFVDKGINIRVS